MTDYEGDFLKHHHDVLEMNSVKGFVITVSTSKYRELLRGLKPDDVSGDLAERMIRERGGHVIGRALVDDDIKMIREKIEEILSGTDANLIIVTGGTGFSPRDVTVEALKPLFEKEIIGFGEIFRYLSYQKNGGIAMLSRATAGIIRGRVVVLLPGSPDGVRLGMELILDQITHILSLIRS
ncbi:MAG: MogA/MoaB family molybdenum cofactor biosynthesis protein [Sulfolobales archaeon]